MCLTNFSSLLWPPSLHPALLPHTCAQQYTADVVGPVTLKPKFVKIEHACTLEALRMTCLHCVVTTSTRLPSRSTGRVRRRRRSRGEAACLQRRQPIPFSLILSHQLPARQSREIDTGFSARSQYMTKLGNTHALPLLRREACRLPSHSWEKPSQEQRSCSLLSLESLRVPSMGPRH